MGTLFTMGQQLELTEEESTLLSAVFKDFNGTKVEAALGQALAHVQGMYAADVLPPPVMHAITQDLAEITHATQADHEKVKDFAARMETMHDKVVDALKARGALPAERPVPAAAVNHIALNGATLAKIKELAEGDKDLERNAAATLVALNAVTYAPEEHRAVMISAIGHLAEAQGVTLSMVEQLLTATQTDLADLAAADGTVPNAPFSTTVQ